MNGDFFSEIAFSAHNSVNKNNKITLQQLSELMMTIVDPFLPRRSCNGKERFCCCCCSWTQNKIVLWLVLLSAFVCAPFAIPFPLIVSSTEWMVEWVNDIVLCVRVLVWVCECVFVDSHILRNIVFMNSHQQKRWNWRSVKMRPSVHSHMELDQFRIPMRWFGFFCSCFYIDITELKNVNTVQNNFSCVILHRRR